MDIPDRKEIKGKLLDATLPCKTNPVLVLMVVLMGLILVAMKGYTPPPPSEAEEERASAASLEDKRQKVKAMFKHAWKGYKKYAWGHDELKPVTAEATDEWGGWGITLVDSIDTMMLLGMDEEVAEARDFVKDIKWDAPSGGPQSVFETTIRHLGGLLGAYSLSDDPVYLDKAKELADRLLIAFNTPSGAPHTRINMYQNEANSPYTPCLAEVGSVQLEFSYLSIVTGDNKYALAANRFFETLWDLRQSGSSPHPKGLWPLFFDIVKGEFDSDVYSIGGQGDSFYEYLLKLWLLDGKKEAWLRDLYDDSVEGLKAYLIDKSTLRGNLFISSYQKGMTFNMDHLSCFVPGMIALGANNTADMRLAKRLMHTCRSLYSTMSTGIGAEIVSFSALNRDFRVTDPKYQLRPEVLESLFILYRQTKDPKYQEWAWEMFLAIEKYCKTPIAYSGLTDVDAPNGGYKDNQMQSFFLAETVKYLYLIFSDESLLPLDKYVLSTEAHPFRRLRPEKPNLV
eukprot:TRINITY_DN4087_c3_g1_i1.p1 TRINITY_DN4087_c3_g1~~TRINITY_DN4087_c3_g1_i1.p1  ORF type:complete len:511 (+),score=73.93 TRINITY_DN4087_c3_g1_i1:104-1636(+)